MTEDEFIAAALKVFPGSRLLPTSGYCDVCATRLGRWSESLNMVLCADCWVPRFYAPMLPKARWTSEP
jgi:hypothetical protein